MGPDPTDVSEQQPVSQTANLPYEFLKGHMVARSFLDFDDDGPHIRQNPMEDPQIPCSHLDGREWPSRNNIVWSQRDRYRHTPTWLDSLRDST
jgi:hypothetical protein